jgi:ABC-type tungstate transport system substrate-binding protein
MFKVGCFRSFRQVLPFTLSSSRFRLLGQPDLKSVFAIPPEAIDKVAAPIKEVGVAMMVTGAATTATENIATELIMRAQNGRRSTFEALVPPQILPDLHHS